MCREWWGPMVAVCLALCFTGGAGRAAGPNATGNMDRDSCRIRWAAHTAGVGGDKVDSLEDGNLVPNSALSTPDANAGAPAGWTFNVWGRNIATGSWLPSPEVPGGHALRVNVSQYKDGDAKWYFDPIRLTDDTWYSYQDLHRSDGRSRLILSCRQTATGAVWHRTIGQSGASASWQQESVRFYIGPLAGCEATILHLVDRNGFLETAHPILARVQPKRLARSLVSVAFDDGWKSAVTTARTDLEARGLVGSYYLVKSLIDHPGGQYASTSDLLALVADAAKKGHEIGSHTAHHDPLSLLPAGQLRVELKENLDWLLGHGVTRPGLAYPFGDFDGTVETEARSMHPYARTSLDGLNDGTTDRYRIRVRAVTDQTDTASILASIDDAIRSSTWLVLLFHDIGPSDPANPYRTSRAQYLTILDRLTARDATVVTVAAALEELGV